MGGGWMVSVQIDDNVVKSLLAQKIEEKLKEVDAELVFWDSKELMRRTCMCWNTIQKEFFFDDQFPKKKIGSKWYFPANKTKQYLLQWISENGR
jgi:hypothetical protein